MTSPLSNIKLAPRAIRDLKGLDRQTRKRVQQAFQALGADAANLDVKPVAGHARWRRLRVGEHWVLYRPHASHGAIMQLCGAPLCHFPTTLLRHSTERPGDDTRRRPRSLALPSPSTSA